MNVSTLKLSINYRYAGLLSVNYYKYQLGLQMGTEQSSSHATSYSSSFKIPLDNNDHKSSTEIYLQNCSLAENSP